MRSRLTRQVLRSLRAYEVALPSPCSLHQGASIRCLRRHPPQVNRSPVWIPRRNFLGIFQKEPRQLKEIDYEPGYEQLLAFKARQAEGVRPPSRKELVQAWRALFSFKRKHLRVMNSTQAACALSVFRHLCIPDSTEKSSESNLTLDDLDMAREILFIRPRGDCSNHLKLSKELYRLNRVLTKDTERGSIQGGSKDFEFLLDAMSRYGEASVAKDLLIDYSEDLKNRGQLMKWVNFFWMPVLRGLAAEGKEAELVSSCELAESMGLRYGPALHKIMTVFYAQRNDVEQTKHWFQRPIHKEWPPYIDTYNEVLAFSFRNNQVEWASEVYRNLVASLEGTNKGQKQSWDVLLQWAVALFDKGVENIEHMIRITHERNPKNPAVLPDIQTINGLVRIAIEKDNSYMAERFMGLGIKLGIQPDLDTFLLQLEYRIKATDLEGAFASYQELQNVAEADGKDEPTLNKLIRALCNAPTPNYDRVLDVTGFLERRHSTLEPETVVELCMAFLRNDEHYEVIDTLSIHTLHYSIEERAGVRNAFIDYCLDQKNSTARVWDAYCLLRQFFPETGRQKRSLLMTAFFQRKRPDMACHVFGHMRGHSNPDIRPTLETYVSYFKGLGDRPDVESLRIVHNMLKMDTIINFNTELYNALMIAYRAVGMPHRALEFWRDISNSVEGPNYKSLENVFGVYQILPYGEKGARELWRKVLKLDIDVPRQVYIAYVASLAGQGCIEDGEGLTPVEDLSDTPRVGDDRLGVKTLLDNMPKMVGESANAVELAIIYNAFPSRPRQDRFEGWVKDEYQADWFELEKKHKRRVDSAGVMKWNI